jgi:hypothetical protein
MALAAQRLQEIGDKGRTISLGEIKKGNYAVGW